MVFNGWHRIRICALATVVLALPVNAVEQLSEGIGELSPVAGVARLQESSGKRPNSSESGYNHSSLPSSRSESMEPQQESEVQANQPPAASHPSWFKRHRKKLVSAFVLIMHCLGFVTSIRAVMETRTSQGAVAWVISLNNVPYVYYSPRSSRRRSDSNWNAILQTATRPKTRRSRPACKS